MYTEGNICFVWFIPRWKWAYDNIWENDHWKSFTDPILALGLVVVYQKIVVL